MSETDLSPHSPQQPSDARQRSAVRRLSLWLFGHLTAGLLRLLGATWRIEVIGSDPREAVRGGSPQLAALFHESMLPCAWFFRGQGYSVAVSRSRDGELIGATLRALGYADPARGSSSRGGSAALRGLLRHLGKGTTTAVLVDGPRGPARVAKTGIIALARLADRPIQPVAFSARPAIRLNSWDRSLIPLPFARVVCAYSDPLEIAPDTTRDDAIEQAFARKLDEILVSLHHAADGVVLGK
jgi:lysophospholipid acyltransferase (LPLAT)-like uncharacterized protein